MGFSGEVSRLRVRFLSYLREVRAFPGPQSLKMQLERDVAKARDLVALPRARGRIPSHGGGLAG